MHFQNIFAQQFCKFCWKLAQISILLFVKRCSWTLSDFQDWTKIIRELHEVVFYNRHFSFYKELPHQKNRVEFYQKSIGCIRSRLVTPCHKWRRPQICNITIYEYQISKVFSELKIFLWCKYAEKNDKFHKLLKLHKDIKFLLQKYIGEVDWKLHIEYYFNINPIWPEVLDPGKHLGGTFWAFDIL